MTLRDVRAPLLDLATVLAREAEPLALAGNAPLSLDSADSVCFVEEGTVEVFAVPLDGSGPRTHLCTVPAGQLLCGAEPDGNGLGFLAVGHTGTRLSRLDLSRLQELAQDPDTAADLAGRLDAWLIRLAAGVFPAAVPRVFEELRAGINIYIEE
ncbi:MAG TPA: hypothetical protein VEL74_09135, partial [Thermoanaerobaculia bacterium]|nr:hypothetical protein [Thermoanaerobaculia bacterium]